MLQMWTVPPHTGPYHLGDQNQVSEGFATMVRNFTETAEGVFSEGKKKKQVRLSRVVALRSVATPIATR